MSVDVCVLRDAGGTEITRFNNLATTPLMTWKADRSIYSYGYLFGSTNYFVSGSYSTPTKYFPLPIDAQDSNYFPTTIIGEFVKETGYQATVNKNIAVDDISISIRISTSPTSAIKAIFLANEVGYYHTSVITGSKYRFVEWRNGTTQVSTSAILSRTITADLLLSAVYEQYRWTISAQSSNATVGDAYIGTSGTATSGVYENNAFVTLRAVVKTAYLPGTATPYRFKRWTLNGAQISTEATTQITTAQADRLYIAEFIPINYALNVIPQNAVQGAVEVYLAGVKQISTTGLTVAGLSSVEVRTVPTFGYYLSAWHNGTSNVSTLLSYAFTMPESNLSLEARYAILPDALLVVTKKKGNGTEDPKDMGSVALFHTVDNPVSTSPVGELTLQASMFTTKQYRLVPTPASALFQFDGWYKTVEGSDVLITDDTVLDVDGTSLYINVLDETQINVIARFSKRSMCTITPVVSDASTYVNPNPAKTAGCTCVVTTKEDATGQWLSGQTITVEARQAAGWELRSWRVNSISSGETLYSKSKGETGFGQTYSFLILENVQVVAVSAYTLPADQVQIQALLKSGQALESGTVEIHPCGYNYVELENGATANVDDGGDCEVTAIPANGYRFVGWRVSTEGSAVITTNPVYSFTVNGNAIYYAEFAVSDGEALKLFEGSDSNMTLRWAGKTYLAAMPLCLSSARIYADAYPVRLDIGMSDNPSHPADAVNVLTLTVQSQNPFRLPMRRPRKSIVLTIEATDSVSEVCVSTSMEGLKNG